MKEYKQLKVPETSAWDTKSFKRFLPVWLNKLIEGVRNIIRWIPILYKDKDWDDFYIFEILKKKLLHQREYLVKANRFEGIEQVNRDITNCLNLIERFQDGYYELEYHDYYTFNDNLFGTLPKNIREDGSIIWEREIIEERFDDYFKKYKAIYKRMIKQNAKRRPSKDSQALYLSMYNHERCKKLIFYILSERIEGWWD